MAKKKKEKNFSSFLNNPIDFTLVITILLLLFMIRKKIHCTKMKRSNLEIIIKIQLKIILSEEKISFIL